MESSNHFKLQERCSAGKSLEEGQWQQMSGGFVLGGRTVCEMGSGALIAQPGHRGVGL